VRDIRLAGTIFAPFWYRYMWMYALSWYIWISSIPMLPEAAILYSQTVFLPIWCEDRVQGWQWVHASQPQCREVKNSKDKMTIHLSQISKGYNLECFIGFVAKKEQAADHGTKWKPGLDNTINSDFWRHGSVSKFMPLLNDSATYLFTDKGEIRWTGKQEKCKVKNCLGESCSDIALISVYDSTCCNFPHVSLILATV